MSSSLWSVLSRTTFYQEKKKKKVSPWKQLTAHRVDYPEQLETLFLESQVAAVCIKCYFYSSERHKWNSIPLIVLGQEQKS